MLAVGCPSASDEVGGKSGQPAADPCQPLQRF